MKFSRLLSILGLLIGSLAATAAEDLAKIERKIVKEPAYHTKPKYCLLVLGPEAKTRVWLVQDGDTLYVDRNGNGDLTEPNEKVAAEKNATAEDGEYRFKAGDLADGPRMHKQLYLSLHNLILLADRNDTVKELVKKNPRACAYSLSLAVAMPGRKGTGIGGRVQQEVTVCDGAGVPLQFASHPHDAPIVRFGGPWQITLFSTQQRLTISREKLVFAGVGTPGIGPGAFTWTEYENVIPADKFPTLDIVYPPQHPGTPPLRARYELKERC